jgi:hypothetical protein
MDWQIPDSERTYLRELAKKQAQYAALPIMARRKQMWFDLNDGRPGTRPPFLLISGFFDRDFMPESVFRCASETGRHIERRLLRNILDHEILNDDKVVPDAFDIDWFTDIDATGVRIEQESIPDSQGVNTGFRLKNPIKNLREDFHILKPAVCRVDKERTLAWQAFLEDLFGNVLPVRLITGVYGCGSLTYEAFALMGMEAFYMAMYDQPDEVHRLMAYLRDNGLRIMHWAEDNGLLRLNNRFQLCGAGVTQAYTHRLPSPGYKGPAARLCDMSGGANSQETVGISPQMYHEFCFPYYRDLCAPLGQTYYGCCEPAHPLWDDIRQLPHLRKVSISRWCDERMMAEALRGTEIVFSRKPSPNFLGLDKELNEAAWSAHIRQTLEATRGCLAEFIVCDVYTVHGNLAKARRAVELARAEIDKYYDPC